MSFEEDEVKVLMDKPIYISNIFVNGIGRTRDDFVEEIYSQLFDAHTFGEFIETAYEVQAKLNGLNVTKGVSILLDKDEKDSSLFVEVNMTERSRWSGGVKSFLGNDNDAKAGIGGGLNVNGLFPNVFGRAEKISCCWFQAISNTRKELVFTKPLGPSLLPVASCSLFNYTGNVQLSGYKENNTGLSLDLTVPSGSFQHKVSWEGVWRQLNSLNNLTCFAVREQAGHSLKSSIKHEVQYDDRDDSILPTEGSLFRLSQEVAGFGGDTKFYSKQFSLQLNQSLFNSDRVVLQLGANAGHIQPINLFRSHLAPKPLSIMDKFYLGGPTTLRGFDNKGIGPRQRDNALGTNLFWQLSAILRLSLPGVRGSLLDKFKPQLFVNCGNTANCDTETSMGQRLRDSIDTARVSYGAGIVTNFVGVRMELNYCVPFKHGAQDKIKPGLQFGISVGD